VGDIWVIKRSVSGWSEPGRLPDIVNTKFNEACPSVTSGGTLYFHGSYSSIGKYDIYRSAFVNGQYTKPEALGDAVNSTNNESNAFIAADESFIIFGARRGDGYGGGDLYISFRKRNSQWSKAVNMGPRINTGWSEYCPSMSPDGKYLFFTRIDGSKGKRGDIYWVSAKVIDLLNPSNGFPEEGENDDATNLPILKGPYLGQTPPGMVPKIFAPGIISTGKSEGCSAFSLRCVHVFSLRARLLSDLKIIFFAVILDMTHFHLV
jgi:hypothetical protein